MVDSLTSKEDSTGFPRALAMPHPPRKMAVVIATPMRMASTLLISGNVVMRQRKYMAVEVIQADVIRRPI